ncbi:MAG TPA: protein kinase [Pyrinomonadaceae bacterium]
MIGQTITHYQIAKKIGEGAMGEVYLAHDLKLNRSVALKFIPAALVNQPQRLARFEREAQLLASLNHTNIAVIHGVEEYQGKPFLVMELIEGETLEDRLLTGPLPVEESLTIAAQVAEALKAAHKKSIIHRDLKPANIKVTADGVVKVLDFGLAKQFYDGSKEIDTEAATLAVMTMEGTVVGTPAYMSPEQALGQAIDARADIFSFGAITYEMLTGRRAFTGSTLAAVIQAVVATDPQSPRRVRSEVPVDLDGLVMRSLQKKKELRQQTAEQLISEIGEIKSRQTTRSAILATSPARGLRHIAWQLRTWRLEHKRAALIASVLVVALAFGVLAAFALKRRSVSTSGAAPGLTQPNANASTYELFQQGSTLLERYDKDENLNGAMQHFQAALTQDPKYSPAYGGLGLAYLLKYQANRDKQLLDTAFANATQAVNLDGQLADNRVSLGRVLVEKGDADKAEAEFKQALMVDPLNAEAHRGLGEVERSRKRWPEAEALFKKAIELRPKNWDLRLTLGNFYFRQSRYAEAEQAFVDLLKLAPDCYLGYRNLGGVYHMQGRFADASSQYQKALTIKPSASTYSNLGTSLFFQGLYPQSVNAMEQAIKLGANNYQIWANLGDAYRWTGNNEKAKAAYGSAIQKLREELKAKPDDADLRSRLDLCLAKSGEKQKALTDAGAVEKLDRSGSVLARLVTIYEICGQRSQALDTMAAAVKAGYSMEEFNRDPELLELRKDPGYHKIVAELSNNPQR